MRNITSQALLLSLAVVACNKDDERTTYLLEGCVEPEFAPPPTAEYPTWDYAPCGCGAREGEPETEWREGCLARNGCRGNLGLMCTPRCEVDADCPGFQDIVAKCETWSGYCYLPCEQDSDCPVTGMYCAGTSDCHYTFTPGLPSE
jgi:hypothetical protein